MHICLLKFWNKLFSTINQAAEKSKKAGWVYNIFGQNSNSLTIIKLDYPIYFFSCQLDQIEIAVDMVIPLWIDTECYRALDVCSVLVICGRKKRQHQRLQSNAVQDSPHVE